MAMEFQTARADWIKSLMQRFEGQLLRYAARITGDVEMAQDVVQDAFISLLRTTNPPTEEYAAEWLFKVCRNRSLDVRRKDRRMNQLSDAHAGSCASNEQSPHHAAEAKEQAGQLLTMLQDLPENQQEVIRLRFQNGFTYQQIASITGLSVSNVGFLIHVAIKTLRSKFKFADDKTAANQEHTQ